MKVLITGANGFVGNHLRETLSDRYHVTALGGRYDADLTNQSAVDSIFESAFDWVIHCAIAGRDQPSSNDPDIYQANMSMFMNLHSNRHRFGHLINIGSGAEFDTKQDINCAGEDLIYSRSPTSGYGASKNTISKIVNQTDGYMTLRLFGSIAPIPAKNTLLRKFIDITKAGMVFHLRDDRYFDWFNLDDLSLIVSQTMDGRISYEDMNLVYPKKMMISDLLHKLCEKMSTDQSLLSIGSRSDLNYTGGHDRLASMGLDLIGLDKALEGLR
jgi:nucleoside-diphosphate-sugar epimerase